MAAISVPHPDDHLGAVAPLVDLKEGEVLYLPSPFLEEEAAPPRSWLAIGLFGFGLALAVVLALSAPALAAAALVGGIVAGGIADAPAGWERRRTAAALLVPTVGLAALTAMFLSWI